MEREKKNLVKIFLQLLNDEELKLLCSSLGKKDLWSEKTARTFIMKKIQEDVSEKDLLQNSYVASLLGGKLDQVISFVELTLNRLEKTDLIKICRDLKKESLAREDLPKWKLIRQMLDNIPALELWRSKSLRESSRPKYVLKRDLKPLEEEMRVLKNELAETYDEVKFRLEHISVMERRLAEVSERFRSLENIFSVNATPDLRDFVKAFYEEATSWGEKVSPESFRGISERLRQKLGIDERTFLLKGIELLLAHYFLTQVKLLPWKPSFETFLDALRKEFEEVKIAQNQAEIPALREHVCRRMGIDAEMFDELLTEAWKKDYVKLDVGAPVGEYDVRYLVTKDGDKFYYVKLKR